MGRAKLTMQLIKKDKFRNLAFQKRKISLKKKVDELSTLCGVKVMMIIYGPKEAPVQDHLLQPDICPEDHVEVLELVNKYKDQPNDERKKRTFLLSNFFENRNKKAQAALTKLRVSNVQAKYPSWDERFNNLSEEKLFKVASFLETKLLYAKKLMIMKENRSSYYAHHLQQQEMLPPKRSMNFDGSNQPNKFFITNDLRQPIYNSYSSHLPTPLQMHIPMSIPLQHRPTLDQYTSQRTISYNPYVGCSSNFICATPLLKAEPNMAYNDPMAGMAHSIANLNNLMTVPHMHFFGDSMQSMARSYIDVAMQPMPPNYPELPIRSISASSQMPAVSPFHKDDHTVYYQYRD